MGKQAPLKNYIVTAEAKGISLAFEISKLLGLNEYIVVRSITTKGSQHLYLDEDDAKKIKGKTVCIVDDVISTGESLRAIEKLMQRAGADTGYKVAILAEGNAAKREDILFLGRLPLFRKNEGGVYEMI